MVIESDCEKSTNWTSIAAISGSFSNAAPFAEAGERTKDASGSRESKFREEKGFASKLAEKFEI